MDVVTLALAKKFAKNYTDSHSVTITPELAEQAIANYFAEHPEAIVSDDEFTDSFTINAGVNTYTYSNSLIKENSVIDVYFADNNLDDLKGIEISFVQTEGSLVFNFNQFLKNDLIVSTMRISKEVGQNNVTTKNGNIKEIQTYSFNYAVSGAIEPKEGE